MKLEEMVEKTPIANPDAIPVEGHRLQLFRMWAGAYGSTHVYVWAEHFEDAFEELVEWLDDNAPGLLTDVDESDYRAAARELGIEWQEHWPDWEDRDFEAVAEQAEADLTTIGHTTLKHGQFIASWEWGGSEVEKGGREYELVLKKSLGEDDDEARAAEIQDWMERHADEYLEPGTGEPQATQLAEAAADEFDLGDEWLEPDSALWDWALEAFD